jgi:hypothetical protein
MAIIDLSLTSDELAESVSRSVTAVVSRLKIPPDEGVYVIGNAGDFDEFCVPAMAKLNTTASACLWPRCSKSPAFHGVNDVVFVQEYIEPVPEGVFVVMLQSVLLLWEEAVAMVTRVLQATRPTGIAIGSCLGDTKVEQAVKLYLERRYGVEVRVRSEEYILGGESRLEFEQKAYDLLDDRPMKIFPNMPEWVLAQLMGRDFDPSPETGFPPHGPRPGDGNSPRGSTPSKKPVGNEPEANADLGEEQEALGDDLPDVYVPPVPRPF